MATDYTVIIARRQRFGDGDYRLEERDEKELEATFVGRSQEYAFSCPNIDSSQIAVLHFQSFGLSQSHLATPKPINTLTINSIPVPGGFQAARVLVATDRTGYDYSFWKAHELLVDEGLDVENVLRIESAVMDDDNNYDNFIIDNVVLFYKTRPSGGPVIGG